MGVMRDCTGRSITCGDFWNGVPMMRLYVEVADKWRRVLEKGDGWYKVKMCGKVVRVSSKRVTGTLIEKE